jgi:hypothetical protein
MTERWWHRPAALVSLCATAFAALSTLANEATAQIPAAASPRQATPVSYSRAEQLLNWHTTLLVAGDEDALARVRQRTTRRGHVHRARHELRA